MRWLAWISIIYIAIGWLYAILMTIPNFKEIWNEPGSRFALIYINCLLLWPYYNIAYFWEKYRERK